MTTETSLSLAEDWVRENLPSMTSHRAKAEVNGMESCDCVPIRVLHYGVSWQLVGVTSGEWGAIQATYRRVG